MLLAGIDLFGGTGIYFWFFQFKSISIGADLIFVEDLAWLDSWYIARAFKIQISSESRYISNKLVSYFIFKLYKGFLFEPSHDLIGDDPEAYKYTSLILFAIKEQNRSSIFINFSVLRKARNRSSNGKKLDGLICNGQIIK